MHKTELRQAIRNSKRQHTAGELGAMSIAAANRVASHPRFLSAKTVMLYCSLADEVDTALLMAAGTGKTIVLPRVTGPATMELRLFTGPQSLAEAHST